MIVSVSHEYTKVEKSYITEVRINFVEIIITSYFYDGILAEEETAPAFHQLDKFNALKEVQQRYIIREVNKNLKENYHSI